MTDYSEEEEESVKNGEIGEEDKEENKSDGDLAKICDESKLNYLTLFNAEYAYRIYTVCPFEDKKPYVFDFYILHQDDSKLTDFNLFSNLWRETLLLANINDPRLQPVLSYGQLPDGIIFREIKEVWGCSLEEHIVSSRDRIPPYDQKIKN
jgi:hypothetical protein